MTANVHVEPVMLSVLVEPSALRLPACKPQNVLVDKPNMVKVVLAPAILPIDQRATAKLLFVPVEITICVPSGLLF